MKTLSFTKPAFLCFIAVAMGTLSLKAQNTKNVAVSNFSEVSVSAGIQLLITQGASESAKIVANSDVIDEVEVTTSGNTVTVGWKSNWGFNNSHKNRSAKVYISYKKLNRISASSGSSIKTENLLKTDQLATSASSGANIDAKVDCAELETSANSGAAIVISGKATNLNVEGSSGANINVLNLVADNATAEANSGADVKVNVIKSLETTANSGGSIRYKGDAALRNSNSRSGDVSKIN